MTSPVKRNFRFELKQIDWDFTGEHGNVGFAGYHWYPARYVPQLPGILINYFTEPGQLVLDPFCGSGTTLLEAYKFGRRSIGIELNPTAALMTRAKLLPFEATPFARYADEIATSASQLSGEEVAALQARNPLTLQKWDASENAAWYHELTLRELLALWTAIYSNPSVYQEVALSAFSAILKACCSQDKHWGWVCDNVKPKSLLYRNALQKFREKMQDYGTAAVAVHRESAQLQELTLPPTSARVIQGDCIEVLQTFEPDGVDFVMTSPPYFGMTDYISSQRLSNLWFDVNSMTLRTKEVGARYRRKSQSALQNYLCQMNAAFAQIARVLRPGAFCCVVIGESPSREAYLEQFKEGCDKVGLELTETLTRRIPKRRSLSPNLYIEEILILRKRK